MKKLTIAGTMLAATLCAAPVWSHHAAEGIVSDEIWNMVNDMLVEADSPHLTNFPVVVVDLDNDSGRATMVTTYEMDEIEGEDISGEEIYDAILEELDDSSRRRGISAGSVEPFVEPLYDADLNIIEIRIFEPIGKGNSQEMEPPELPID